jgi:6-phosphogluconolactonase
VPVSVAQHTGTSVNVRRQEGPHAHCVNLDPAKKFLLVCDLGLDKVLVYRLGAGPAALTPNDPPFATCAPGVGPRHLAFRPDAKFVHVLNELNSTITTFEYDKRKGTLREGQTVSTLPAGFSGSTSCAEIEVHPSGKFVYASNRGHDSIAVFKADKRAGLLSLVEHEPTQGKTPRHFALDPAGRWLLAENQGSDSVVVFRVDSRTGALESTGQTVEVPSPVCAVFVAATK